MANQLNYNSDITNLSISNTKFMVSRILDNEKSSLLELQVPAELKDISHVEISLYSLVDNSLVYFNSFPSTVSGLITVKTLTYEDASIRKLVFIDFSKTDIQLIDGRYQAVFNFFAEEIGSSESASLFVTQISPSRREVELRLAPTYRTQDNIDKLKTFASPQINTVWALDAIKQVFNQPGSTNSSIPTDKTALTFEIVTSSLPPIHEEVLSNENTPEVFITKTRQQTQLLLDSAYGHASRSIAIKQNNGSVRFTNHMLNEIVSSSLGLALQQYVQVPELKLV
jgi:hypothetical protein